MPGSTNPPNVNYLLTAECHAQPSQVFNAVSTVNYPSTPECYAQPLQDSPAPSSPIRGDNI